MLEDRIALPRRIAVGLVGLIALGAAAPASATAAGPASCGTAVSASLPSSDPTALADDPWVRVRARSGRRVTSVTVTVRRGKTAVASGSRSRALTVGGNPVELRLRKKLRSGRYAVTVAAKVKGCTGTVRRTMTKRLRKPSLPVRAAVRGSANEGGATVVRVLLRPIAGARPSGVRVRLKDRDGRTIASSSVSGRLRVTTDVALTAPGRLTSGSYRLEISGRAPGTSRSRTQPVVLRASTGLSTSVTPSRQRAVVDWSGGAYQGREIVGFVIPGIGHGELVCSPETQWIRVYPTDPRREVSMMNWAYRDWRGGTGKEIREGLHTRYTGPDFSERFANFLPAEKQSTGEFIGLIADRGPFDTVGTGPYAPPVSLDVRWTWDFSTTGKEKCYAQIDLVAQTDDGVGPAVGSAQVVWRGDAAAAGRDVSVAEIPGVGRLNVTCQAGPNGQRTAIIDGGAGGTIVTRESTWDGAVPQAFGPLVVRLPNNGQVQVDVATGARVLISSRWKVNDPDPTQNFCAVAAQAVAS